MVVVNASREILTRYTSLSNLHVFTSWCSGTSYVALIACIAMCMVHVQAQHQRNSCILGDNALLTMLAAQRLQDRCTMEHALKSMQRIAAEGCGLIASQTATMLEDLLVMEATYAVCRKETETSFSSDIKYEFGCHTQVSDSGETLRVYIPSFGAVRSDRSAKA